jgi:hemerythrin-like domain-containing protein
MCDHCDCRSFAGIAELSAEHDRILVLAWDVAEATRTGAAAKTGDHVRLVELLQRHVVKEETGLYPRLRAAGSLDADASDALEDEHREIDGLLATGRFDRRAYLALAAHIEQEEMELFPGAMFAFEDDDWEAVGEAHRAADLGARQVVG